MVETYRGNWPKHTGTADRPAKDTILVTGTTGSLGAGLLARLVQSPEVEHIYALNRFSEDGTGLLERQKERLKDWGFDPEIVDSPKVTFIEADMSAEQLGMSKETYEKVRSISGIRLSVGDAVLTCVTCRSALPPHTSFIMVRMRRFHPNHPRL